ncbi:MAG: AAA family ATPase, partial [Staphylococcus sp.]|nr:AAA family ATPase [Staphylococcus sp.]
MKPQISWKVGGQQGEGIESTGEIFATAMNRKGYYLYGYRHFSSRIKGGHTNNKIRVSTSPVHAISDDLDILVAFDQETIELNHHEMREDSIIIADAKAKQEEFAQKEDYESAINEKMRIQKLQEEIDKHTDNQKVVAQVNDVAEAVERMTGIPVSQMGASDIERLKDMKSRLQAHVIGQDKAVEAVSKAIRRNRAGFDEGNRPIGSFLFVGPTGVGKTELAKQLALDMFGNKDAIIRLDMSEYSDRTAVSKLIGTTAGYVGYEDNSNTLTERVRRNPYSIVLFDEIEKADPQVITLLLQVLDDGRLTDGQ